MPITLTAAHTARLFAAIEAQQQALFRRRASLPDCPACGGRPRLITVAADGDRVDFDRCGHQFTVTRSALRAGLAGQRAA